MAGGKEVAGRKIVVLMNKICIESKTFKMGPKKRHMHTFNIL